MCIISIRKHKPYNLHTLPHDEVTVVCCDPLLSESAKPQVLEEKEQEEEEEEEGEEEG